MIFVVSCAALRQSSPVPLHWRRGGRWDTTERGDDHRSVPHRLSRTSSNLHDSVHRNRLESRQTWRRFFL